jgi:hypothetical protein
VLLAGTLWILHHELKRYQCADIKQALAAGVCYVLLPASPSSSYPGFLGLFLLAPVSGVVSQVPGDLGVLETVLLPLLSSTLPAAHKGLRKKEG